MKRITWEELVSEMGTRLSNRVTFHAIRRPWLVVFGVPRTMAFIRRPWLAGNFTANPRRSDW